MFKIEEAVRLITKTLQEDRGWYDSYVANIAMQFHDEHYRYKDKTNKTYLNRIDIMKIANVGADNFLKLWSKNV